MGNLPHGTIRKPAGGFRPLTREDAGEFPVPGAFGPYRVLHQVGTGVLGPVYLARESDGDRAVAIKSFHLDLTPEQVEVFANALAHIVNVEASHPAIVAPLAAGLESGTPFMAYEYVEAESLDVVLRREARPAEGLAWISALADAVDAAHALGLVHGALHLRDVLVSSEGLCATGFGIASALEHVQLGFPVRRPYTAPEVMAGRRWGPPADRFAVAVLAYELLTGTRPSAAGDEAISDLVDLRPDVADPAGLQQAFRNALAEDPDIRSASATGFVAALARASGDEARASRPAASPVEPAAFAAGPVQESAEDRPAAQVGAAGPGDYEPSFGSPREPSAAAGSEGGAAGRASTPPVQIALPDAFGGPEGQDAGAGTTGDDDGGARGARSRQPARPPRSKRRPPYRPDAPRRSGPVVAVRDEVQWDPLDEPRAARPPAPGLAYGDDDVPPPPSPTSIRTVAPVVAAMAVGVVVAYLVSTGLGTSGDDSVGITDPPSESAGAGVEWSEQTVAGSGGASASVPAGAAQAPGSPEPQALVEEQVVPVGDPPTAGGAPPPAPRPVDPDPREQSPPVLETEVAAGAVEPPAAAGSPGVPGAAPETARPRPAGAGPSADPAAGAGSLYVDSRPAGAAVRVDDVVVGATPVEVSGVDFGARRVRIEMPGYRPWATEVDVSGTERIRVAARLEPEGRR